MDKHRNFCGAFCGSAVEGWIVFYGRLRSRAPQPRTGGKKGRKIHKGTGVVHTKAQCSHPDFSRDLPPFLLVFAAAICYNEGMKEIAALLKEGETGEKFARFYDLLCEWNEKFNLTGIRGREECYRKNFADSLLGEAFFPAGARCAEVGSGGGFPSVPLMIARPDLSFTLIESVGKKCEFLRAAVRELSLPAEVVCGRAEELGKDPAFRETFDVCCARAVARLNTLAEYCVPLVRVGGLFIAYKGDAAGEIAEAGSALRTLGAPLAAAHPFTLPGGEDRRTVAVCKKISATPPAYPRGRGRERSKPL